MTGSRLQVLGARGWSPEPRRRKKKMFNDMKWMVTVDATSFEAEAVASGDVSSAVAVFADENDAKIFTALKNFARYFGNK
jgi:hypothetical protein